MLGRFFLPEGVDMTGIVPLALLALASSASAGPPVSTGACETAGDLRGLCHAYCDALDCDSDAPRGSATACDRVLQNWLERSPDGARPPCGLPAHYRCLPEGFALPETIAVKRTSGEIETLDLEEYVKGVVPKEIGTTADMAALEAQAIASRTYALRYIQEYGEPICSTTSCQVYGNARYDATDQAVENTRGVVGWYDGELIWAFFHPSSGGHTTSSVDRGWLDLDYLVAVSDLENATRTDDCDNWYPVDAPICEKNWQEGCCWGRFGHGVGMSQRGARAMAACGYDHAEILTHYYQGITLAVPCGD